MSLQNAIGNLCTEIESYDDNKIAKTARVFTCDTYGPDTFSDFRKPVGFSSRELSTAKGWKRREAAARVFSDRLFNFETPPNIFNAAYKKRAPPIPPASTISTHRSPMPIPCPTGKETLSTRVFKKSSMAFQFH